MVIVVTVIAVVGTALVGEAGLGRSVPQLNVRPHELLIVIVIIAGAISAALANSTMAAVLSLGVVGYGVATTFLLFGAPDLAMTQFSVETLTVVIYVLVFRHFTNLGALSPRFVRFRDDGHRGRDWDARRRTDAVGVDDRQRRRGLREYFTQFGPTLGHGRNIVNVILVDFRGFDTMGEITVLATAAIGVRALLGFAADRISRELDQHRACRRRRRFFVPALACSCRCSCCSPSS